MEVRVKTKNPNNSSFKVCKSEYKILQQQYFQYETSHNTDLHNTNMQLLKINIISKHYVISYSSGKIKD